MNKMKEHPFLGLILILTVLGIFVGQLIMGWHGVNYYWGPLAATLIAAASTFFLGGIPMAVATYFGMVNVFGFSWFWGILAAAPFLALLSIFLIVILVIIGVDKSWNWN